MPCTTMEFAEAQMEPGNPRYPLKAGSAFWARMNFSAARSSSPVVIPGRALPRSRDRQRASTRPAAAILSISSGVFRTITVLELRLELQGGQCGPDVPVDLVRRAGAVESPQQALVLVPLDHRLGLLVVDVEPLPHGLGLVVVPLLQARAILVADPLLLRGIELHVIGVLVLR